MNHVVFSLVLSALVCTAATAQTPAPKRPPKSDMSEMPADAHAPLFRPKPRRRTYVCS